MALHHGVQQYAELQMVSGEQRQPRVDEAVQVPFFHHAKERSRASNVHCRCCSRCRCSCWQGGRGDGRGRGHGCNHGAAGEHIHGAHLCMANLCGALAALWSLLNAVNHAPSLYLSLTLALVLYAAHCYSRASNRLSRRTGRGARNKLMALRGAAPTLMPCGGGYVAARRRGRVGGGEGGDV